jgi:general secretion pathway protein G
METSYETNKKVTSQILNESGMSLIEILIVITLIATIGAFVGSKVFEQGDEGKYKAAKIYMQTLAASLEDYKLRCGSYPENLDQMKKGGGTDSCENFPKNGFIRDQDLKDPWGNPVTYSKSGSEYTLISYGADGQEGGTGRDKDISSDDM